MTGNVISLRRMTPDARDGVLLREGVEYAARAEPSDVDPGFPGVGNARFDGVKQIPRLVRQPRRLAVNRSHLTGRFRACAACHRDVRPPSLRATGR